MSEPAPTDVDDLVRRVQAAARARPIDADSAPRGGDSEFDDHADAFALAVKRCEQAFSTLGRAEPRRSKRSRHVPAEEALFALRDLVDHLVTRYRHDIVYVLEQVAELERRSLVAEDVALRVDLLERSPNGVVVDLAHIAAWFERSDVVLWIGDSEGPLHDAVARAAPVMIYEGSIPPAEQIVGAAVIAGRSVTDTMGLVVETLATGGLLVVVVETPAELTAMVGDIVRAGFDSTNLTWLADEPHGVAGSFVVTLRRRRPR